MGLYGWTKAVLRVQRCHAGIRCRWRWKLGFGALAVVQLCCRTLVVVQTEMVVVDVWADVAMLRCRHAR